MYLLNCVSNAIIFFQVITKIFEKRFDRILQSKNALSFKLITKTESVICKYYPYYNSIYNYDTTSSEILYVNYFKQIFL